eukprot:9324530-Ditylum_brightwellii.AAC.1
MAAAETMVAPKQDSGVTMKGKRGTEKLETVKGMWMQLEAAPNVGIRDCCRQGSNPLAKGGA